MLRNSSDLVGKRSENCVSGEPSVKSSGETTLAAHRRLETSGKSQHATSKKSPWLGLVGVIITLANVGWSADLLEAWRHSPLDHLGWVALLMWISPVIYLAANQRGILDADGRRVLAFIVALGCGVLGTLASLNVLQHMGLTIACAAWLGCRGRVLIWSAAAISWMPALGWLLSKLVPSEFVFFVRILIAGIGAAALLRHEVAGARRPVMGERGGPRLNRVAWPILTLMMLASVFWQFLPLRGAEWRLMALPIHGVGFDSRGVALTDAESKSLGSAIGVRRLYFFGEQQVMATAVDATHNRHAVHDPLYCFTGSGWKTVNDRSIAILDGSARHVTFEKQGKRAELVFWFSNGQDRHASISRYWWQTTLRRLTVGFSGREPLLVMLHSYDQKPIDWRFVLTPECPFFAL